MESSKHASVGHGRRRNTKNRASSTKSAKDEDKVRSVKSIKSERTRKESVKEDNRSVAREVGASVKEKTLSKEVSTRPDQFNPEAKKTAKLFVKNYYKTGIHALRLQYNEMKSVALEGCSKDAFDKNVRLSRYKDIPCWDRSRVVLKWPPGESNDFIHANYVRHELLEPGVICTQGPTDNTVGDFWRMIWQEKVRLRSRDADVQVKQVIMLCQCTELNKPKCSQYWPNTVGQSITHFGLTVKCEKVDTPDKSFIYTKLLLQYGEKKMTVDHRQWVTWPDKSVPKTPLAPFRLLQFTRRQKTPAGVGRTGTLVALEIIYRTIFKGKVPDVRQIVLDLRSQRSHAVQTEDQYLYLFYASFQLCHLKGMANSLYVKRFCTDYTNYLKLLNEVGGKNLPLDATEKFEKPGEEDKIAPDSTEQSRAPVDEPPTQMTKLRDDKSKKKRKRSSDDKHKMEESKLDDDVDKKDDKEAEGKIVEEKKAPGPEERTQPAKAELSLKPVLVENATHRPDENERTARQRNDAVRVELEGKPKDLNSPASPAVPAQSRLSLAASPCSGQGPVAVPGEQVPGKIAYVKVVVGGVPRFIPMNQAKKDE